MYQASPIYIDMESILWTYAVVFPVIFAGRVVTLANIILEVISLDTGKSFRFHLKIQQIQYITKIVTKFSPNILGVLHAVLQYTSSLPEYSSE